MRDLSRVDLGSVQVHKRAIADIAVSALSEIDGVSLIPSDLFTNLKNFLGDKQYPGIAVTIDKNNQVTLELKLCIRYGISLSDIAQQIQEAVRSAVERTVDITLKDIHVNIQGIERGKV